MPHFRGLGWRNGGQLAKKAQVAGRDSREGGAFRNQYRFSCTIRKAAADFTPKGGFMLRRLYEWTMAKADDRRAEWWLALFAFLESSMFPIPPHPLMGLMCLAQPRKAVRFAFITTTASVTGGLLGYAIGHFVFHAFGEPLLHALGLARSFPAMACTLRENAFWIIVLKGMTPIPFKLVTITAGFIAVPIGPFLLASVISRGTVFMTVGVLFRLFGTPIKAWIDRYLAWAVGGFLALVAAGFFAATLLGGHHQSSCAATSPAAPAAATAKA
jgi:membrane protein YqaA with SNARE-associated domain